MSVLFGSMAELEKCHNIAYNVHEEFPCALSVKLQKRNRQA